VVDVAMVPISMFFSSAGLVSNDAAGEKKSQDL
jgi:hypothetical protein